MATKQKYTDSHWLVFGLQGLISLIFGWYIMFTDLTDTAALITIIGWAMLALGGIELLNVIYRHRREHNWGLALSIALAQITVAVSLLLVRDLSVAIHLSIVAGYTILRGVFEILIGLRSLTDPTDRFLWIITGMFGVILGFVIFNSGDADLANTSFIKIFGTYTMVFGLTNLIFSVHLKNTPPAKLAKPAKRPKK